MKTKPLVVLCWTVVALAAVHVALHIASQWTRPWIGFDYSRVSGRVTDVVPSSPADRVGLRIGDTVRVLNGNPIVPEGVPVYFARAGAPVGISVVRGGRVHQLSVVPITQEQMRRAQLQRGGRAAILAINGYLSMPLHIWMVLLPAMLLLLRPGHRDASLAALALASWAGGVFMARTAGFGVLIGDFPYALRASLLVMDAIFIAAFFAFALHLALTFPSDRKKTSARVQLIPYVVTSPILLEGILNGLRRAGGNVLPAALPWRDAYTNVGVFVLLAALITLAVRTYRMQDPNPRRRLQLIFFSLLPGSAAFIVGYLVLALRLPYSWDAAARLFHTPGVILGSAIFAYAIVRHRMFNVRVLVRRSLQYALARGTLLLVMALPVVGLAVFLYAHRADSLAVLLTAEPAAYVLLLLPLAAVVRYRRRLLEALDRRFFREQYDARQLLLHVVSIIRGGSDMLIVSRVALEEIDRALHPRHVSIWQLDAEADAFHRGFTRGEGSLHPPDPLPAGGTLATLVATTEEPLDVHSRQTRELLQRLPESDRAWLAEANAYLLVPLLIDSHLAGLLVLGERRSEEPYSRDDRELLRLLASQLAMTLDYARLKHSPSLVWSHSASSAAFAGVSPAEMLRLCPRCGRSYAADGRCDVDEQPLVAEPGVPRVIEDKYVVTRLLGRGGMGAVYQATQKRLNRPVAVKVLLAHLVGSMTMRSRFEREARIVSRLRHPSIVTIHDFGMLPSGHAYLVMEHLDGETLRKLMAKGPIAVETAIALISGIGDAVDAAHRAGIIHRDLKPENVMVVRDHDEVLSPRVLDFGLARMTAPLGDDDATLVQSGQTGGVVGTLMYMAPEILSGHAADMRADQYSLALIAYEMLAGEHPLGRVSDLASVVRGHTEMPMIPIRERVTSVPQHVAMTIDRGLAKQPSARWESVGAFVSGLRG